MKFVTTAKILTNKGEYSFVVTADNYSISVFRNGYSNWDGKKTVEGFEVKYINRDGKDSTTWCTTRKDAILEAIYQYIPFKDKYISHTLEK